MATVDGSAATVATTESTTTVEPQETTTAVPQESTTSTSAPEALGDGEVALKPGLLDAGTVVLADEFDVSVALTTEGGWKALEVGSGAVVIQDVELVSPFTRGVLILSADPFAAESVDEWAAQQEAVTVEARMEAQVSGYETIVYDLIYDGEGDLPVLTAPATCQVCGGRITVRNTEYYRIWVTDIGADKPLVLFSTVLRDDLDWLEKAQGVVDSVQIG